MLLRVAEAHVEDGEYKDALKSGRQAMLLFHNLGDKSAYHEVLMLMVQAHRLDSQDAGEKFEDSLTFANFSLAGELTIFQKNGDKRGRACIQLVLGENLAAMTGGRKNLRSAVETIESAIVVFKNLGDKKLEAAAQLVLSNAQYQRARIEGAKNAAILALSLFKEIGDYRGEAKAHHSMALALSIIEDFEGAAAASNDALRLYEEHGDMRSRAFELQVLAQWYIALKKLPKAVVCAKQSMDLYRGLKNAQQGEVGALLLACEAMVQNGRERQAVRLAKEACSRFKSSGDKRSIALGMEVLLHAYILAQAPEEAQQVAREAVQMVGQLGNKKLELNLLHAACAVFSHCGCIEDALQTMRDALSVAQEMGEVEEEAIALRTICSVHMSSGDIRLNKDVLLDATQCAKDAQLLFSQSGYLSGEGSCATILAMLKNTNSEIIAAAKKARSIFQDAEDAFGENAALKLMCEAYLVDKEYTHALNAVEARVTLWKGVGRKSQEADALHKLACVHLMQEDDSQAEEKASQAKSLARAAGATALEAGLCLLLAQVYIMRMSREVLPKDQTSAPLPPRFVDARKQAFDAITEALDLSASIDDTANAMLRASVFFWRSEVLLWSFRGHEALQSALLAHKMFNKMGVLSGQVHAQVMIGDIHLMMSNRDKAKEVCQAALSLAQSMADGREEEDACQALSVRIEGKKDNKLGGGPGTRVVRKLVKKWRKKKSSSGGGAKKVGLEVAAITPKLTQLVKEVLVDNDDVAQDDPFMEAGIDSLGSVQLITDVGKAFSMSLAPSVTFDYPNIRALAEYLAAESAGAVDEPASGGGDDEWEEYEDWEEVEEEVAGSIQQPEAAIVDDTAALLKAAKSAARSEAIAAAPKGLDAALVRTKITNLVLNVIAGDEEIEQDNPLMEAGVDSLGSVQLVTDIAKEFSMSLAPSVVFDFPTIRELVTYVVEESQS